MIYIILFNISEDLALCYELVIYKLSAQLCPGVSSVLSALYAEGLISKSNKHHHIQQLPMYVLSRHSDQLSPCHQHLVGLRQWLILRQCSVLCCSWERILFPVQFNSGTKCVETIVRTNRIQTVFPTRYIYN